jgi:hypothetical protein
MRRIVMAVIPLLAAAGCDFFDHKQKFYTYCDDTGCYTCDETGCRPRSGAPSPGRACRTDADCSQGCYCNTSTGSCTEAGFCDQTSQCSSGLVCDVARHSCHPSTTASTSGGANTVCKVDTDCAQGYFCHPTTHQCLQSFACRTSTDCGAGMVCDSRHTCVPGPMTCTSSSGCAAGCYCQDGRCNETAMCKADGDCASFGANFTCQGGTCAPTTAIGTAPISTVNVATACQFNVECGTGGLCRDGQCHPACTASATCGSGQTCTSGHCFDATGTGGGGDGVAVRCQTTADCTNPADVCTDGVCNAYTGRVAQCKMNSDCSAGQECVNALCRSRCFADNDCNACGDAPVCSMGYCLSKLEAAPQCRLAGDCGVSQSCVNATCQ